MASVMNPGRREKDDALTTILKGLQIAQGIYGIKTDMAELDAFKQDQDYKASERQRIAEERQQQKPKEPTLTQVETVDEKGNPVTKFVVASEGLTLPKPNKTKDGLTTPKGNKGKALVADTVVDKPPQGKFTEAQSKAAYHANRALDAENVIAQIENSGYNPADVGRGIRGIRIPLTDYHPFENEADKSYKQAQEEFITSVLRPETGASVTPAEFEKYATIYFPRPGDTPQIVKQKAVARQRAVQNLIGMAGSAYDSSNSMPFAYTPEGETGKAIAAPGVPKKGDEQDGYIFKGGDPSDPKNWEKK